MARHRPWLLLASLVLVLAVAALAPAGALARDDVCAPRAQRALAARLRPLLSEQRVAGLDPAEAAWVLFPVTRERALPRAYAPADLTWTTAGGPAAQGHEPVRAVIVPDLEAMFAAAQADGVLLAIYSGYRSYDTQQLAFDGGVQQQLARGAGSRDEAEARANRFRARPGHSQHQLGTTVDLTAPDVGWRLSQTFGETAAGQWLRAHAWEYGFVLPYTAAGEPLTGYAPEPWHWRWVGRPLASVMAADHYLDLPDRTADDYLLALDALLAGLGLDCPPS